MSDGPSPRSAPRDLWWLNILLLLATLFTTTCLGVRLQQNFTHNLPPFDLEHDFYVFLEVWREPALLRTGLAYSLALMAILLAHELGHYLVCRYYHVSASPPYFLPAPTFIGTLGAFIRFRSPVHNRHELFDIGVAGPLAGFVMLLPALGIGLAYSKVIPGIADQGEIRFGTPLLVWLAEQAIFPGVHAADIYLHPLARAAWVGLLATSLNLLPIGQLDGGHLIYAWLGDWHKHVTLLTLLLLAPLGFLWPAWWLWVLVLFFVGRRHFAVFDPNPLSPGRRLLLAVVGLIFVLSFIPAPVMYNGEQGLLP